MTLRRRERGLAEIGIVAAIACVVGATGIFIPDEAPLGARMAVSLVGFVAAWALMAMLSIVGKASARLLGLSPVWGYAFAVPVGSAVIAWVVLWSGFGLTAAMGPRFAQVWPQTMLIGAAFFVLFFVLYWRAGRSAAVTAGATVSVDEPVSADRQDRSAGVADTPLHERLPPGFPPILALSVEDHYVRAHGFGEDGDRRSEMVLMPLAEAVSLMPDRSGEQVHRSWWVARAAVESHRRAGRDLRLVLVDGTEAPVSRAMVKPLREAGWL